MQSGVRWVTSNVVGAWCIMQTDECRARFVAELVLAFRGTAGSQHDASGARSGKQILGMVRREAADSQSIQAPPGVRALAFHGAGVLVLGSG